MATSVELTPTEVEKQDADAVRNALRALDSKKQRRRGGIGFTIKLSESYGDKIQRKRALRVGQFIESRPIQTIILVLFLLDVAIVLAELILEAEIYREELGICEEVVHANNITYSLEAERRALMRAVLLARAEATTAPAAAGNESATEPPNHNQGITAGRLQSLHALELAERILHWISVSILALFVLELLTLLFIFGKYFLFHILYVIDLVIVSVSLGLEVGLNSEQYQDVVAVLVFIRLWRLVRAGHGLFAIQAERSMEKLHHAIVKNAELKADVKEYQLEMAALERLLNTAGIEHPEFATRSDKFHHKVDRLLDPEQEEVIDKWLADAERQNALRINSWFHSKHGELSFSRTHFRHGHAPPAFSGERMEAIAAYHPGRPELAPAGSAAPTRTRQHHAASEDDDSYSAFLNWKRGE